MVPFAGYEMPVQYPPASSPNTCTPAPRPACSTCRIWARSGCAARRGAGAGSVGPGGYPRPGAAADALHAAAERFRRHPRRSDGDADRRRADARRQRARKEADLAHLRRSSAADGRSSRSSSAPCWHCRGRPPPRCWRACPGLEQCLHDRGRATFAAQPCLVTRSGYTGEDGFEISLAPGGCARSPKRCWRSPRWRRSASAPATRCASKPASASTATISTRRRPRSRPASPGPSASAVASRAAFPVRATVLRQLADGAARARVGIRPDGRAPAREGTAILDPAGNRGRHGHQRRLWPDGRRADRDGLRRRRHAAEGAPLLWWSAMYRGRRMSRRCPLYPPAITAAPLSQEDHR